MIIANNTFVYILFYECEIQFRIICKSSIGVSRSSYGGSHLKARVLTVDISQAK